MTNNALLHAIIAQAVVPAAEQLSPRFEQATGYKVVISGTTTGAAVQRIQGGEIADLAILTEAAIRDLVKQGKLDSASVAPIASCGIGLAVRAGAEAPDISSVAALKQVLLSAKSIAYSDPATGGTSGVYFARIVHDLGIADQVIAKTTFVRNIEPAGALAASGEVELAVQMESELLSVEGAKLAGLIPRELQNPIVFLGAVFTSSKNAIVTRSFIQLLKSPEAISILESTGVHPEK